MAYVYRHIREDKNQPFYIGIGSDSNYKRAKEKNNRNKYWKNIVSKTKYRVEILLDNLTFDEAKAKEKEFIILYGRVDMCTGMLCNMTNGGDGCCGLIFSNEHKQKISNAHFGKKLSNETKFKMSESKKGEKHNMFGKKGNLNPLFGKKLSYEHKENMSKSRLRGKCYRSKKVIDIENNIIYDCIKTASEKININYRTLLSMLRGYRKNKTNLKYIQ